jgi:hypothetical protein
MRRVLILLLAVLLPVAVLSGEPKKKSYEASPEQLFQVALQCARANYVITLVDEKLKMITFQESYPMATATITASIEPESANHSSLSLTIQFDNQVHGAGHVTNKFFDRVDKALANSPKLPEAKPAEPPTTPAPAALAVPSASQEEKGTVNVICTEEGAEIAVDDAFVGNPPATLKLVAGKHIIKITKPGMRPWIREVTVMAGAEVHLNATLEKLN